ncbi:hypothetical protein P7C71_g554, partial [Lecanoromycetidae sp. Uapishka_2]
MESLRETFDFAARRKWKPQPQYDIVRRRILEIQQDKRPGADPVVLDDEFSPASRRLWDFAMIERVSGNVLINACVDADKCTRANCQRVGHSVMQIMGKKKKKKEKSTNETKSQPLRNKKPSRLGQRT